MNKFNVGDLFRLMPDDDPTWRNLYIILDYAPRGNKYYAQPVYILYHINSGQIFTCAPKNIERFYVPLKTT